MGPAVKSGCKITKKINILHRYRNVFCFVIFVEVVSASSLREIFAKLRVVSEKYVYLQSLILEHEV